MLAPYVLGIVALVLITLLIKIVMAFAN